MLQWLRNLDRRWIYLAMLLAVTVPILTRQTFPERTTPYVQAVFDKLEGLPEGSTVLISLDYDPSTAGELEPMATAVVRHCCLKRHKILFLTLFETGKPVVDATIRRVVREEFADRNLVYGEDYVDLGYKPGREAVIAVSALDLRKAMPRDYLGTALDELPVTANLRSLQDVDLIFDVSAGWPGFKEWIQYAASPFDIPFAAGITAVQGPLAYPYVPNQMLGLLAAVKGAAEYEIALGRRYPQYRDPLKNEGIRRMAPQFWAHLLIIGLIVLGNGIYVAERWKGMR